LLVFLLYCHLHIACDAPTVHRISLLMIPKAPRFTLFPYTTLFRSREKAKRHEAWVRLEKACEDKETVIGVITGKVKGGFTVEVEDRKSTRLNSSHVKISYAVFCLKKKKTVGE